MRPIFLADFKFHLPLRVVIVGATKEKNGSIPTRLRVFFPNDRASKTLFCVLSASESLILVMSFLPYFYYYFRVSHWTNGLDFPADSGTGVTRIRATYQQPIQAHAIRDYISSHPRIFLPIFIFLLGSLTYTVRAIADLPLVYSLMSSLTRSLTPSGYSWWKANSTIGSTIDVCLFSKRCKLMSHHFFLEYKAWQWLRTNTVDRFYVTQAQTAQETSATGTGAWKERQDAEGALGRYLSDLPSR